MASSKNKQYEDARDNYKRLTDNYTGSKGYATSVNAGETVGAALTSGASRQGMAQSRLQNNLANKEAQKYAGQQADATAKGAQSQATTAARAAGMNKAQAAMMGAQQNANAYQNAYGNAYGQQLGQANSNINSNVANYGNSMLAQQNARNQANMAGLNAYGTMMGAAQNEGQAEYDRKWGNAGNTLGIVGSTLKAFSDEDLKHYRECSKKVTIRSPKSIEKLKFTKEGATK